MGRSLAILEAVIGASGHANLSAVARQLGLPVATVHRHVAALIAQGYLTATAAGQTAGPRLLALLHRIDEKDVIARLAEPVLTRLAEELGAVVQLGSYEQDMVTYRLKTGQGASSLFTQVGMQLEAYCSAIGKVLLAHLPPAQRDAYLAGGPFVPLTPRTIVEPAALLAELAQVRARSFARDDGEIAEDLSCLAVPIFAPDGSVPAAISLSRDRGQVDSRDEPALVSRLQQAAAEIASGAFGRKDGCLPAGSPMLFEYKLSPVRLERDERR